MKNSIFKFIGLFAILLSVSSCTNWNRPEPNCEGVLMTNYGETKNDYEIVTGAQGWLGFGSSLYNVPMFEQKGDCDPMKITAKGGGVFDVDPSYTYEAVRGRGIDIIFNFKAYRSDGEFLESIEKNILNTLVVNAYKEAARDLTTDTILYKLNEYELEVEKRVRDDFEKKGFKLNTLTSGLTPPPSMVKAIEARNNASIEAQTVQNQLQAAIYQIKKDSIQRISNKIKSDGLTPEIIQMEFIKTLPSIKGVIITDGRTPIILNK
jgi:hypothetical protein